MEAFPTGFVSTALLGYLLLVTAVLVILLVLRPGLTETRGGKILAFLSLFLLPLLAGYGGVSAHLDHSKKTEFCLSCHVMEKYGKSLLIDDRSHVPAVHFQNNLVPREAACYTCHTDYTLYGGINSKLRGLRHLYVQYLGTLPEQIKLYSPYNNRECLYCHGSARSFEESATHNLDSETMVLIRSNQLSCTGCHDLAHDVDSLENATFWKEPVP